MRSLLESFQDLIEILTRKTRFYGFFPYSVSDEPAGRPSLTALTVVDGLPSTIFPDQLHVNKAHGLPGTQSHLQSGHILFLGFVGGDPGSPFVAFYPPNQPLPVKIQINATTEIRLGSDGGESSPAAYGVACDNNFASLRTKVNALCTIEGIPPLGALPSVATHKVLVE